MRSRNNDTPIVRARKRADLIHLDVIKYRGIVYILYSTDRRNARDYIFDTELDSQERFKARCVDSIFSAYASAEFVKLISR